MTLAFEHSFATELQGLYVPWQGQDWPDPQILLLNTALAHDLGLDPEALIAGKGAGLLTGSALPPETRPVAQAYAGHQFGGFSPQLGDGRALLLGEIIAPDGHRVDLHLKGSGRTPFARGGDGRAVLGPVLREYLISEAMTALGVPTTRALSVCTTGDRVLRQFGLEPGAVLGRVAASHLRVGTFQFCAARGDHDLLRRLLDYAVARHDPDLIGTPDMALAFLERVCDRQVRLVARWMGLGFVHGVMNTDNTTISGETIDYGPCAFMDRYDQKTVFSSIDHQGRYAYGNQPAIILWNLARLAEALLPLIDAEQKRAIARASAVIEAASQTYRDAWCAEFSRKLGLTVPDLALVEELHALLQAHTPDFTVFFTRLADALEGDDARLSAWLVAAGPEEHAPAPQHVQFLARLRAALGDAPAAAQRMRRINPIYIPRNHLVEEALSAASDHGDLAPFSALLDRVQAPFDPTDGAERFALGPPEGTAQVVTFCGT
ncbi:MAG: protein adenylyltransferase SelO [Roseinatronobacter sp.]